MKEKTTPDLMPRLSAGRHRSAKQGACFMEFASYLAGERWSDHPACTHPLLAALARDVNDLISDSARARLMPLVTRVIGLTSNDPRLSISIALRAAAAGIPIASLERQRALAVGILTLLRSCDDPELREIARHAFQQAPDSERWARSYLDWAAVPSRMPNSRSVEAVVHTSAVGIALACVTDADDRLEALLAEVIEVAEASIRPGATATPVASPAPAELQTA
jgi:hypothetical protein